MLGFLKCGSSSLLSLCMYSLSTYDDACHLSFQRVSPLSFSPSQLIIIQEKPTKTFFSCLCELFGGNISCIEPDLISITRMEDPGEEWEIVEYPIAAGEEASQSKISWILSKGLWLGKKAMITGFVVSSAPVVLPPLVVVSALGFAVSVPFGFVFASYKCTEKLMSKLLPIPESFEALGYAPLIMDKAEEDAIDEGEFDMEEEEKKQIQDTAENVEVRMELVDDGNKEQEKGSTVPETDRNRVDDTGLAVQEKLDTEEAIKEKGYEEDDGEYLEGDDEGSLGGTNVKIEGKGEDSVEKSLIKEAEDETPKPVGTSVDIEGKGKGSVGEPLIKENEEEMPQPVVKRVVVVTEHEEKRAHDVKKTRDVVVIVKPLQVETESGVGRNEEAELKKESTGLLDKIRDEGVSADSVKKKKKKNKSKESLKKVLGLGGAGTDNPDAGQVAEVPAGNPKVSTNGNRSGRHPNLVDEDVKQTMGKKQASQAPEKDNAVVSSGRENVHVENDAIHKGSTGNEVPFKAAAARASTKNSLSEKNLWEQINAMRVIIGYKAARHTSFTEELKALYVFTGVEPPSSFAAANIRDAEDKLRFLMSIVGVK